MFEVHHVVQGIEQRPEVWIDLRLQIPWQKAQSFTGFNRGLQAWSLSSVAMAAASLDFFADYVKATQRVFHKPDAASYIDLPVAK